MDKIAAIREFLKEVQDEITDVKKLDTPSYQLGVTEGLTIALEILNQNESKNKLKELINERRRKRMLSL